MSSLLVHLRGTCQAPSLWTIGGMDWSRVIERSATPYVPGDDDVTTEPLAQLNLLTGGNPIPVATPLSPSSVTGNSSMSPNPGTPLQDKSTDTVALMREMVTLMKEINQGIKTLNDKLSQ